MTREDLILVALFFSVLAVCIAIYAIYYVVKSYVAFRRKMAENGRMIDYSGHPGDHLGNSDHFDREP